MVLAVEVWIAVRVVTGVDPEVAAPADPTGVAPSERAVVGLAVVDEESVSPELQAARKASPEARKVRRSSWLVRGRGPCGA